MNYKYCLSTVIKYSKRQKNGFLKAKIKKDFFKKMNILKKN